VGGYNPARASHEHDPRLVDARPFDPSGHPDQRQFYELRRRQLLDELKVALHVAQRRATARNLPPQVRCHTQLVYFPGGTFLTPLLLAAANPHRLNFTLFSTHGQNIGFTYGFPVNRIPFGGIGPPLTTEPMTVATNGLFKPGSGTCSIDEIWICLLQPPTLNPTFAGIYEYSLDVTGNERGRL